MAVSRQAFNQVRSILRELDQRITDARRQRSDEPDAAPPEGRVDESRDRERQEQAPVVGKAQRAVPKATGFGGPSTNPTPAPRFGAAG